ncbi:Ras family GTPase RAS1 [Entamoeba marina]
MQQQGLRLIVLGGGGVGKSSIVIREVQNVFVEIYDPTIEDSYRKLMVINDERVILDILDTAGAEEYPPLRDQYIWQSEGFIIVYSITRHVSFEEVSIFYDQFLKVKGKDTNAPIIIAGNKIDLENERQVTTEEGQQLADELGVDFIECSAKEDINIDELFETIALSVIECSAKKERGLKPERKRGCLLC